MQLSLKQRTAIALFILILIPFLFFFIDSISQQKKLTNLEVENYLVGQSRITEDIVNHHLQYLKDEARYIANHPDLITYIQNPQLLVLMNKRLQEWTKANPSLDLVLVVKMDGTVGEEKGTSEPKKLPFITEKHYQEIMGGIERIEPQQIGHLQSETDINIFYATAPIYDATRHHIIGLLFVGNVFNTGNDLIKDIKNVIRQATSVTPRTRDVPLASLIKVDENIYIQPNKDNAYIPLRNINNLIIGWIQIEFSLDGIRKAGVYMKYQTLLAGGIFILIIMLISWLLSTAIYHQLGKLLAFVQTVQQGNIKDFTVSGNNSWGMDEIGQVAKSFTKLSIWINDFVTHEKQFSNKMHQVNEIRKQLSSILDMDELAIEIVTSIQEVIGADRCSLWLNDESHQILRCAAMTGLDDDELDIKKLAVHHGSGIIGKVAKEWKSGRRQLLIKDISRQVRFKGETPPEYEGMRSLISIALLSRNEMVGVLNVSRKKSAAFTNEDIDLISILAGQAGVSIQNAVVYGQVATRERLKEELDIARDIQTRLLPRQTPSTLRLDIKGEMVPAREVGGDYFDYIEWISGAELGIIIGDVSGKGVSAGLIMMRARTVLHTLTSRVDSPKENLVLLNKYVYPDMGVGKFMTMLYLRWNGHTRKLSYSSAGHEHILVYRTSKRSCERIKSGGLAIGLTEDLSMILKEKEIDIEPGDGIVLYTDGVTEARSEVGTLYGLDRLQAVVGLHGEKSAKKLHHILMSELFKFMGTSEQYDDITLITMKFS